jgi:pyruvate dehydrogenase E1 component alpha subunit
MNMAVVLKVPAVFVFENNGYAEHTGADYAVGSKDIAGRARGFGMPAETCDGSDFFAVYEAAGRAIARGRAGEGPATLEPRITRYYGHFEGDPQLYRAKDEAKELRETMDCLKNFRARVTSEGWLTDAELDAIDVEVLTLIDSAVKTARAAPPPSDAELVTDVYATY